MLLYLFVDKSCCIICARKFVGIPSPPSAAAPAAAASAAEEEAEIDESFDAPTAPAAPAAAAAAAPAAAAAAASAGEDTEAFVIIFVEEDEKLLKKEIEGRRQKKGGPLSKEFLMLSCSAAFTMLVERRNGCKKNKLK